MWDILGEVYVWDVFGEMYSEMFLVKCTYEMFLVKYRYMYETLLMICVRRYFFILFLIFFFYMYISYLYILKKGEVCLSVTKICHENMSRFWKNCHGLKKKKQDKSRKICHENKKINMGVGHPSVYYTSILV